MTPTSEQLVRRASLGRWALLARAITACVFAASIAFSGAISVAQESEAAKGDPPELRITGVRLGFDEVFKLGCWTQMEVTLVGGDAAYTGAIEVTAPDSDGVSTQVISVPERPIGIQPGQTTTARLFVRVGKDNATLRVRFIDDTGRERESARFTAGSESVRGFYRMGIPATNRLIVTFGMSQGIGEAIRAGDSEETDEFTATRAVRLANPSDLPLEWYGYEGVDTVILGSADPAAYRPLAGNLQRVEALDRWIKSGGRLVIFAGANAPELLGPDGVLAPLAPGAFDKLATLGDGLRLQEFSGSQEPINRGQPLSLQVPRLADLAGRVVAYAGDDPAELPLVVRSRRGMGEITFVAVDPDAPPLAGWTGRAGLVRQALGWPIKSAAAAATENVYNGSNGEDMLNQLRRALDTNFQGVKTVPFGLVALLVILYILLIGPGDYLFVKRVLKRMEATWITFPLIVVGVSAAAYWFAYYMKGDQLRVNQVEIVDVDMSTGEARGTVWTHYFSPRVDRFDLTLQPHFAEKPLREPERPAPGAGSERLVAWLGQPGYGLGGMQGQGGGATLFDRGYAFATPLDALQGMPVQEWSTKTLTARWSAVVEPGLDADLTGLADDLLAGTVANNTGLDLDECLLMHGNRAYLLQSLAPGAVATIDDSSEPRTVKTALLSPEATADFSPGFEDAASQLAQYSPDVAQWARAMMFYEALGGDEYSPTAPSRYQSFVDMSRLLAGEQAVLLARATNAAGSQWSAAGQPLASPLDRRWIYYRFVIPLKEKKLLGPSL